jgi:hypothetical protein
VDADRGQLVYRSLKDVTIVMDLDELAQSVSGPRAGDTGGGSSGSSLYMK